MIKRLIQLIFLALGIFVLGQLEYKGRPLKDHAREIYNSPTVRLLTQWARIEVGRLLNLKEGPEGTPGKGLEHISPEDQKTLDTLLKEMDR